MSLLRKVFFRARIEHSGMRLDHVLSQVLPIHLGRAVSKGQVRKLIVAGAVYLNGKRVRIASKELLEDARVEVYVDLSRIDAPGMRSAEPFILGPRHVLFEDDILLFLDKPPGLPTQPTLDNARDNLFKAAKDYLRSKTRELDPYLALHHRLDRDTSGVIVLVKRRDGNARVASAFSEHRTRKTYRALTERTHGSLPPETWEVRNLLGQVSTQRKKAKFGEVRSGGNPAETRFRRLEVAPRAIYVEAQPLTGRTHQIRVHLAEKGLPILGDGLYGARSQGVSRVMLHALRLEIPHPLTGDVLSIESPLPADFLACWRSQGMRKGGA